MIQSDEYLDELIENNKMCYVNEHNEIMLEEAVLFFKDLRWHSKSLATEDHLMIFDLRYKQINTIEAMLKIQKLYKV